MKLRELPPGRIDTLTIAGGKLRLGQVLLDESYPSEAFVPLHGDAGIEIREPQLEIAADRVIIKGTTSLPILEHPAAGAANPLVEGSIEVVATFHLPDPEVPQTLGIGLRYRLPVSWRFSDSFPDLEVLEGEDSQAVNLDDFKLSDCFLHLRTHAGKSTQDDGGEVSLDQGLSFVGLWNPEGLLGLLEQTRKAVLLHGPVILSAEAPLGPPLGAQGLWDARHRIPGIHLQADLAAEVSFPPNAEQALRVTKLGLRIFTPLVWRPLFDVADHGASMAYVGSLVLPGPDASPLANITAATWSGAEDQIVITGSFDGQTRDRLMAAIGRLAGGDDATQVLPPRGAEFAGGFGLKSVSLVLVRQPGGGYEVESTSLTLGMDGVGADWAPLGSPFSDLIRIAFESAEVAVVKPFNRDQRAVLAMVRGSTQFLGSGPGQGLKLNVTVDYPGFRVTASQQGTTKVSLKQFGAQELSLPGFLDLELEIADIALVAEPGSCAFSMDLAHGRKWTIGDYAWPHLALSVSCHVEESAHTVGWRLKARTQEGDKAVPIVQLIEHLCSNLAGLQLPTAELPAAILGLTVHEVGIAYRGKDKLFAFQCAGTIPLDDGQRLTCEFTIDQGGDPAHTQFGGRLRFEPSDAAPLTFTLTFGTGAQEGKALVGLATARIRLRQVVAALGSTLGMTGVPEVPDFLDLTLESLFLYFDIGNQDLVLGATTDFGSTAVVVFAGKGNEDRKCAVLVDKHLHLGLSSLPLVSDKVTDVAGRVAGIEDLGIESLQLVVSHGLRDDKPDVARLNGIIDAAQQRFEGGRLPRIPEPRTKHDGTVSAASGAVRIHLGVIYYIAEKPQPALPFPYVPAPEQNRLVPAVDASTAGRDLAPARSQAVWFDVQRSFGPVNVRRLGIACVAGEVQLLLDAAVVLSGLTMELQGLSLALPVDAIFKLERSKILESLRGNVDRMSTRLDGLSLSFESGPLSISGGLLSVTPPPTGTRYAYDGTLQIKADKWTVSAIGSFAELNSGGSSLFAFGYLNAILGGPAFFFVTGIAAGFGYNRNLTLPALSALPEFPLIAACTATSEQAASIKSDIGHYLYPAPGRHWIAAGVRFTSFRMIDSFALFTVIFGERLELALMGLSTLTLPAPPRPGASPKAGARPYASIAHAQLALEASYAPDDGVLKVAAQLTPESYILSKDCQLSGGFALHTWFQDEFDKDEQGQPTGTPVKGGYRSGDFVLSLGGYHPDFKPPAHYPSVPRVAANWRVNEHLSIKGSLYFALTPLAIMTGGTLDANFSSANFKAWFNTRVDFLLYWEPLSYQANQRLILGASYDIDWWFTAKTIKAQVAVDLDLYGPPFGGKAVVDLYVCSFTIDLGAKPEPPKKLEWHEFEDRLLPAPAPERNDEAAVCLTRAAGGLIREFPSALAGEPHAWVVDPEKFVLAISSAIPCSEAPRVNGRHADTHETPRPFGVRPCEFLNGTLKSQLTIEWLDEGGQLAKQEDAAWDIEAVKERLPSAIWGSMEQPAEKRKALSIGDFHGDQLTEPLVTGFTLRPRHKGETRHTEAIKLSQLPMTTRTIPITDEAWARPVITRGVTYAEANRSATTRYLRLGDMEHSDLVNKRRLLSAALAGQGIELSTQLTTRYLVNAARQQALLAAPSLWELGEMQPS